MKKYKAMKHIKSFVLICCATLMLASCGKLFTPEKELMYGKWQTGSTYYRFDRTSVQYQIFDSTTVAVNGARWNTSDDVSEDEAQPFIWSLNGSELTITTQMFMGGKVPKTYTVTAQTKTDMTWQDSYGNSIQLTKK